MATETDKTRLSYADLCRMFPDEDNVRRELIDGELVVATRRSVHRPGTLGSQGGAATPCRRSGRRGAVPQHDAGYGDPAFVRRGDRLTSPLLPGFEAEVQDLLGPEPEAGG